MVKHGPYEPYQKPEEVFSGLTNIRDKDGKDWYDVRETLDNSGGKFFIQTAENGSIVSFADSALVMFPMNMSVYEMDAAPKGVQVGMQLKEDGTVGRFGN